MNMRDRDVTTKHNICSFFCKQILLKHSSMRFHIAQNFNQNMYSVLRINYS